MSGRLLRSGVVCIFLLGGYRQHGWAQATVTLLSTGGTSSRVVAQTNLFVSSLLAQPALNFDFGFGTDEVADPEQFLDSFTLTVKQVSNNVGAVFFTIDAGGLILAPDTPSAVVLDPASLHASPIAYPSLQPMLANRSAFHLLADLPPELVGTDVQLIFSLFDNQDNVASQGWFGEVSVVPEPGIASLLLLGLAAASLRGTTGTSPAPFRK